MELFVYLKNCFRYSGFLLFNGPSAHSISLCLRLFGMLISLYTIITSLIFIVYMEAPFIEKVKSLQGAQSLGYVFSIHVIFTLRRKDFFKMMEIIEKAVEKRELLWKNVKLFVKLFGPKLDNRVDFLILCIFIAYF